MEDKTNARMPHFYTPVQNEKCARTTDGQLPLLTIPGKVPSPTSPVGENAGI